MKIGASRAHLAIACGMIRSTMNEMRITPIRSQTALMLMRSRTSPSLTASTSAILL